MFVLRRASCHIGGVLRRTISKSAFIKMDIEIVPALDDNFMYLINDLKAKTSVAVDPVEPKKIFDALKKKDFTLSGAIITHHHWDHAGGNKEMLASKPEIPIYGGCERVEAVTNIVKDGDVINLTPNITAKCFHTPCHTKSHICYFIEHTGQDPVVFTGDTLFVGGCGRFFEGTAKEMVYSLQDVLAKLPQNTKVYCGHEYTVANLKFGQAMEPNNKDISEKLEWAKDQRSHGNFTIPSTIGDELKTNVFMRAGNGQQKCCMGDTDRINCMHVLRETKNNFKV